jgi:hypothetical protein
MPQRCCSDLPICRLKVSFVSSRGARAAMVIVCEQQVDVRSRRIATIETNRPNSAFA